MFEELREQASEGEIAQPEDEKADAYEFQEEELPRRSSGRILGMTAWQRFFIAVMLLMMTCILSTFCLLVMDKISPF